MDKIQIFKKTEDGSTWEFTVLLGHDARDVGFLVKVNRRHWQYLTGGNEPPEKLLKRCFHFLLKKQTKYSIRRAFDLREIHETFPDFEVAIKKSSFLPLL